MLDPDNSARLREDVPDEPLLANLSNIRRSQRIALVTLLGGTASRSASMRGFWCVPELGVGWAIWGDTLKVLERNGLVEIGEKRAKLTRKGIWYARSAAYREADERSIAEQCKIEQLAQEEADI